MWKLKGLQCTNTHSSHHCEVLQYIPIVFNKEKRIGAISGSEWGSYTFFFSKKTYQTHMREYLCFEACEGAL